MANSKKPPLPPYFPDVRYRLYPKHIQKLSDAAFKAEFEGKYKEAEKKHKELIDALNEQAKKGITDSGLNARTATEPYVNPEGWKGGKTRRKRRFSRKSNGKARRSRKASPPSTVRKFRQS